MRRPLTLAALLAALLLGAGCGGDSSPPVAAPAGTEGPREPCEDNPPGRVADGVNDDQGGSRPGTDPCAGE